MTDPCCSHSINLRAYAVSRYSSMGEREQEDQLNDRSRIAIGTNAAERVGVRIQLCQTLRSI